MNTCYRCRKPFPTKNRIPVKFPVKVWGIPNTLVKVDVCAKCIHGRQEEKAA